MGLMFPRQSSKIWNMNFTWLSLTVAVLFLFSVMSIPDISAMANNSSVATPSNNNLTSNENEKNTTRTIQNNLKTQTTKTATIFNYNGSKKTEAITKLHISINPSNDTGASTCNDTDGKLLCSGFQPIGKSWRFLIGVLIAIVTTTLLIITAIKFPVWYRNLVSYNHSRLDDDEPGTFEENFSTDTFSFPPAPETNENDSIVVFEQFHTFVPEEDGFIEDKYIDT